MGIRGCITTITWIILYVVVLLGEEMNGEKPELKCPSGPSGHFKLLRKNLEPRTSLKATDDGLLFTKEIRLWQSHPKAMCVAPLSMRKL